ncbi:MAG: LLM class F420-dependent oxidoreductase [Acidimicrobiia bacterium]
MLVDATLMTSDLGSVGEQAQRIEALGYDGLFTAETQHDPFFPLLLAAQHTTRLELGTSIAVAFPRSPLHLAHIGHDLAAYSKGRFILGLGSQVKAHIEKRFSATFSHPAPRMREIVLAAKAIWKAWETGEPLRFEGEFYRHTLMTPFFTPPPSGYGAPRIFIAAVGEKMTEVVGEVADGMFVHGFTTEKYLRETTLPAIERGLAKGGRSRSDVSLSGAVFMVTGADDAELEAADVGTRRQIAFYGSTPAYRGVLEAHGWGDLGDELNAMSKRGEWVEMGRLITDDVLDVFAVAGKPSDLPGLVMGRFGDVLDRLSFYAPYRSDPEMWADVVAGFKNAAA